MKIILIVVMIMYVLVAIFITQYMYTTAITGFEMSKGIRSKEIMAKFRIQAALSGIFFPISLTILIATIMAKKRLKY